MHQEMSKEKTPPSLSKQYDLTTSNKLTKVPLKKIERAFINRTSTVYQIEFSVIKNNETTKFTLISETKVAKRNPCFEADEIQIFQAFSDEFLSYGKTIYHKIDFSELYQQYAEYLRSFSLYDFIVSPKRFFPLMITSLLLQRKKKEASFLGRRNEKKMVYYGVTLKKHVNKHEEITRKITKAFPKFSKNYDTEKFIQDSENFLRTQKIPKNFIQKQDVF